VAKHPTPHGLLAAVANTPNGKEEEEQARKRCIAPQGVTEVAAKLGPPELIRRRWWICL
jgi:hypothetical protein